MEAEERYAGGGAGAGAGSASIGARAGAISCSGGAAAGSGGVIVEDADVSAAVAGETDLLAVDDLFGAVLGKEHDLVRSRRNVLDISRTFCAACIVPFNEPSRKTSTSGRGIEFTSRRVSPAESPYPNPNRAAERESRCRNIRAKGCGRTIRPILQPERSRARRRRTIPATKTLPPSLRRFGASSPQGVSEACGIALAW
jgi:hypothetical protein